jgi:predicted permease
MDWNHRILAALTQAGHDPDIDVVEELAQHARAMHESARADGAPEAEALRRVDVQVALWAGDAALLRRRRTATPVARIETEAPAPAGRLTGLGQDVRYALRVARRQPLFALLVVGTIALGIGASAALFAVTYGVLMKPLPWAGASRVVLLEETRGGNRPRFGAMSNAAYHAWRQAPTTVDEIGAWSSRMVTVGGAGDPERLRIASVSPSLFRVLGVQASLGILFEEADAQRTVAVVAEGWWKRRLGGDAAAVGRSILFDGVPHTVVGILPDRLAFPDAETHAWVPFDVPAATGNLLSMFSAVARLKAGATPAQAAAEGTARGRYAPDTNMTTRAVFGGNGPVQIAARPLREAWTSAVRAPLLVLLAAVVLLFVAAAANIASVQLARASARHREMAIRAALGADARRLARQIVVENVLLGLAGGAAGLAAARLLLGALPAFLPDDFPRVHDITIDFTVIAAALAASVAASVAIAPSRPRGRPSS